MIKTDKVKIVIFSGGTGAASLLHGLKHFDTTGEAMKITSIINGYDDGASGGAVRKVMNVLCPGDLRKNQWHQHKWTYGDNYNRALAEFANGRYNLPRGKELNEVLKLLDAWDFEDKEYHKNMAISFFNMPKSKDIIYENFNVSNIIYATMIKHVGYVPTFNYFRHLFGIEDDVMLISEDNLQLCAISRTGEIIETETPGIIKRCNSDNPIDDIFFAPYDRTGLSTTDVSWWQNTCMRPKMTQYARAAIEEADLLIFAPGTQWSSLIPTYATLDFDDLIKKSNAKKMLLMNNTEDYDNLGQTAGDILNSISKYLTLDNIDIFINNDTTFDTLKDTSKYTFLSKITGHRKKLGFDENFLHDYYLTAKEILKRYYHFNVPEVKFFDFDDTIYSRDPKHTKISEANLILLNEISEYSKCVVVSGNDYETIHKKLVKKFGAYVHVNFDIWADGGIVKYEGGKIVHRSGEHLLQLADLIYQDLILLMDIPKEKIFLRGDWPKQDFNKLTCIGIKPLTELEKRLLILLLNEEFAISPAMNDNEAKIVGLTGIDILNKNTDKTYVLDFYEGGKRLYVGDELYDGNDKNISNACEYNYNVKSPYDTNILLTLLKAEKV